MESLKIESMEAESMEAESLKAESLREERGEYTLLFSLILSHSLPFSPILSHSLPFSPILSYTLLYSPILSNSLLYSPVLSYFLPIPTKTPPTASASSPSIRRMDQSQMVMYGNKCRRHYSTDRREVRNPRRKSGVRHIERDSVSKRHLPKYSHPSQTASRSIMLFFPEL